MLPGETLSPDDLLAIVRRRFWLLLVPLALLGAGAALYSRTLPDLYESAALVSVIPQQIPATFVPTTLTTRLSDRVQAIRDRVLSRPRLEKLILDFDLYAEERRTGIMEDVVNQMRYEDLSIEEASSVAYRIQYVGREPVSTMRVAQEVASAFIAASLEDRSSVTAQTNDFLESVAEEARQRLVEREQQLVAYQIAHAGELPAQAQANMQAMSAISTQLQGNAQAANEARQRQLFLRRELANAQDPTAPLAAIVPLEPPAGGARAPEPTTTMQALVDAQRQLALVSARYSALHPDVQRWTDTVRELERKVAAENAGAAPAAFPSDVPPAEAARQRRIEELEEQLAELDKQLMRYAAEEERLRAEFDLYKSRLEAAPRREAELTELMRDYDQIKTSYTDLRRKSETAMLAAAIERREIGEQFRLLEPATVPERPFSPDRPRITLMAMIAGLALGAALIGVLEYRNRAFATDKQVEALLGLPVLALVPVMQSDAERRNSLVLRVCLHAGLSLVVLAGLAVAARTMLE